MRNDGKDSDRQTKCLMQLRAMPPLVTNHQLTTHKFPPKAPVPLLDSACVRDSKSGTHLKKFLRLAGMGLRPKPLTNYQSVFFIESVAISEESESPSRELRRARQWNLLD
jgi:hypothetical protein